MFRYSMTRSLLLCVLIFGVAVSACQAAQPGLDVDVSIGATVSAGISIGDARAIAARYDLTGAKPLPPGIAKNLARGKPLPPGIAKKQLPQPFVEALPRHAGYEWRQSGVDLVLVVSGTLVITDILEGVFD